MIPKILYMELLDNNYGNKKLDISVIDALSDFAQVTVVTVKNWFDCSLQNVELIEYDNTCDFKNNKINYYAIHVQNLMTARRIDKQYDFDCLFFASFHSYVMALSRFVIDRTDRIYIMHHNNIDWINNSKLGMLLFPLYKNKVNHVVLNDFIKRYLVDEFSISNSRVHVLPHPLNKERQNSQKLYNCVGISNSNDENWVRYIYDREIKSGDLEKRGLKVVLRAKSFSYSGKALKILNHYLSTDEYYSYISSTEQMFLPFPSSFRYRMSGSIIDALSNHTKVIGSKIPVFQEFEREYPNLCHTVNSAEEFWDFLINTSGVDDDCDEEFDRFNDAHSRKKVVDCLRNIFEK